MKLLSLQPVRLNIQCVIVAILVLLSPFISKGQNVTPETKVSLITVGPGTELYSGFGHSLISFGDPSIGIDMAYNYGTFSFQTDNFYVKFLRGTLPYKLDKGPLGPQFYHWVDENRSVTEQVLNLSMEQKQRLFDLLEENYKPENREYQYKFFYDNCATRLQDLLIKACGDSLKYEGYTKEVLSFRQWIDRYAYEQNPWADFGMDLAIGAPADAIATPTQATFLPDNLMHAFAAATNKVDGAEVPLVGQTMLLYEAKPVPSPSPFTPKVIFWGLAIIIAALTFWQIRKQVINFTVDKILFSIAGFVGIILLALWFGTNHQDTTYNWDILWATPLLFLLVNGLSTKVKKTWLQFALIGYAVLLLAATSTIEKHNGVIIPVLLALVIRVYYINNAIPKIKTDES